MRIGIDSRELGGHATGVGRFLGGLLREWSSDPLAAAHEFVLYSSEPLAVALDPRRFRARVVPGSSGTWWEQVRLPQAAAADDLDVFFAPAYTAPLRIRAPIVALIHDLSYVAHPEWFRLREGARRRWLTRRTAAKARALITPSEFSRGEIIEHLGVDGDRIHVIPQGIDWPPVTPGRPRADPRVLYVGSIFNRRHVPDLIRAVAALPGISLDIVGDNRTFPYEDLERTITNLQLDGRVQWHRYVTTDRLMELYGRARAFAFLSEYEGLDMTPLEALGAGIPPVMLDTAIARESCGAAALYVPLGDHQALVRALERALFDEEARATILSRAPAALAKYNWPRAAHDTLAVIEAAARSG